MELCKALLLVLSELCKIFRVNSDKTDSIVGSETTHETTSGFTYCQQQTFHAIMVLYAYNQITMTEMLRIEL